MDDTGYSCRNQIEKENIHTAIVAKMKPNYQKSKEYANYEM